MKKIASTLLITLLLLVGCANNNYKDYKYVEIFEIGSFLIPDNWKLIQEKDGVYYMAVSVDTCGTEQYDYYLVGKVLEAKKDNNVTNSSSIEPKEETLISSQVFSNSTFVGEKESQVDGKKNKTYFMDFYISPNKYLSWVVLNDTVTYDTITKIAKSFSRPNTRGRFYCVDKTSKKHLRDD